MRRPLTLAALDAWMVSRCVVELRVVRVACEWRASAWREVGDGAPRAVQGTGPTIARALDALVLSVASERPAPPPAPEAPGEPRLAGRGAA